MAKWKIVDVGYHLRRDYNREDVRPLHIEHLHPERDDSWMFKSYNPYILSDHWCTICKEQIPNHIATGIRLLHMVHQG